MQERREGDLGISDALGCEPQCGLAGQEREVAGIAQHPDSGQVDLDEVVEVAELVERRHPVEVGGQIVDAVAAGEGEQGLRAHRPFKVDM